MKKVLEQSPLGFAIAGGRRLQVAQHRSNHICPESFKVKIVNQASTSEHGSTDGELVVVVICRTSVTYPTKEAGLRDSHVVI